MIADQGNPDGCAAAGASSAAEHAGSAGRERMDVRLLHDGHRQVLPRIFRLSTNLMGRCRRGIMTLRLDSYRPAMPVVRVGFGQSRNYSLHFSRPSALLTVKNGNSTKWQSHFIDTLEPAMVFAGFLLRFSSVCRRERAGRELPLHKSNAARREKTACPFVIETAQGCTERCG